MIQDQVAAQLPAVQNLPAPDPAPSPVLNNPTPISPITGTGIETLLGYALWGALIACGVVALISGGILAVGQLSNNPGHSDKGKRSLLYALGGVAIAAIAIPTLNTVFHTVNATA
jgi:hypothetical protein